MVVITPSNSPQLGYIWNYVKPSTIYTTEQTIEMNIENTKAQMRKGILELCVLSIIDTAEMYPSDIIKKLKASKMIIVEGTLYPLLNRLLKADLLSYNWKESNSGPPRKYYQITEIGTEALKELKTSWKDLEKAVNKATK